MRLLYDRPQTNRFGEYILPERYIDKWHRTHGVTKPIPYRGYLFGNDEKYIDPDTEELEDGGVNFRTHPTYWAFYAVSAADAYEEYNREETYHQFDGADAINNPIVDFQKPMMLLDKSNSDGSYDLYGVNLYNNQEWKFSNDETNYEQGYSNLGTDYNTRIDYLETHFSHPTWSGEDRDSLLLVDALDGTIQTALAGLPSDNLFSSILKPDFQVFCFSKDNFTDTFMSIGDMLNESIVNYFLYYDHTKNSESSLFAASSFPIKINLGLNLHGNIYYRSSLTAATVNEYLTLTDVPNKIDEIVGESSIAQSVYRFNVVQWGDEDKLLTDEEIENSFYFNSYVNEEDESTTNTFDWTINMQKQLNSKLIFNQSHPHQGVHNLLTHNYKSPGIKNIKIIVYRYSKDDFLLLQTVLVTKNIVINDGNITAQDFEIFGGTEFNFLPVRDNQVIIGGLSEDSKYIISSKKIKDNDLYSKDDYLSKSTTDNFIKKYNDGMFGKDPGKIDLGTMRNFRGVKRLGDMTGSFHATGSENDNSLITNIFIDKIDNNFKRDTTLELNSQKRDFHSLQNTIGTNKTAVLIGDYELEKKKEENPIRKKGFMNPPQIDKDIDKQAV
jgi:hypothetical protein